MVDDLNWIGRPVIFFHLVRQLRADELGQEFIFAVQEVFFMFLGCQSV